MSKREKIEKEINKIIKKCFETEAYNEGRLRLQKLYLKEYNKFELNLSDMCTKRNLLYRLIFAERSSEDGNETAVKNYVLQLKHDMDNTKGYKECYTKEYLDMLSYYFDCPKIKATNEEKLEYYEFAYNYYKRMFEFNKDNSMLIRMINMEFNKYKLEKNFLKILDMIKNIHNIGNNLVEGTLQQMLCDIKEIDEKLYKESLKIIEVAPKLCV